MEQTILRSQVFQELQKNKPFDMVWVTCDRRRGTGGKLISAEGWMVVSDEVIEGEKNRKRMGSKADKLKDERVKNSESRIEKDPNHPDNGTVNVFNPENSGLHIYKVHYDLILVFNEKRVIN
jgi:hypothetical protein